MFKFATKSLSVAALAAGLVVGGAGIASAGTHGEDGTSIDDSGNVVINDNLNDLVDADVDDILSNNILADNDLLDLDNVGNNDEGGNDEEEGDHSSDDGLVGGLLG